MFRHEKIQEGIHAITAAMDAKEMTMIERWYACLSIQKAAEGIMGKGLEDIAQHLGSVKIGGTE